jgi:hypothetical protein
MSLYGKEGDPRSNDVSLARRLKWVFLREWKETWSTSTSLLIGE